MDILVIVLPTITLLRRDVSKKEGRAARAARAARPLLKKRLSLYRDSTSFFRAVVFFFRCAFYRYFPRAWDPPFHLELILSLHYRFTPSFLKTSKLRSRSLATNPALSPVKRWLTMYSKASLKKFSLFHTPSLWAEPLKHLNTDLSTSPSQVVPAGAPPIIQPLTVWFAWLFISLYCGY